MKWWPFGKRSSTTESPSSTAEVITLYQVDPPHVRAEKIFRACGLGINLSALTLIPGAANAIAAYQRMDAEAAEARQKDVI